MPPWMSTTSSSRIGRLRPKLAAHDAGRLRRSIQIARPGGADERGEGGAELRRARALLGDGEAGEGLLKIERLEHVAQGRVRGGREGLGAPAVDQPDVVPKAHPDEG